MLTVPVLTYHSQNITCRDYSENDHVALARDLLTINSSGMRVIPLEHLITWLNGELPESAVLNAVCITFDDGCDFDYCDMDFPGQGPQRSLLGIMQDFAQDAGAGVQPGLHATSFVIASREARQTIDKKSLFGRNWISDHWWPAADQHPLMSIENHGWDHNHPDLAGENRGNFHSVDSHADCLEQVVRAGSAIESVTGRWPAIFAYPFGESSVYLRDTFFPDYTDVHGCQAAFGTHPGPVSRGSNRWDLPRYVCGRDWRSPDALEGILQP